MIGTALINNGNQLLSDDDIIAYFNAAGVNLSLANPSTGITYFSELKATLQNIARQTITSESVFPTVKYNSSDPTGPSSAPLGIWINSQADIDAATGYHINNFGPVTGKSYWEAYEDDCTASQWNNLTKEQKTATFSMY